MTEDEKRNENLYFFDKNPAFADRPAFLTEDGFLTTYHDLYVLEDQILGALPPRSLIFILCRNHPDPIAGYLGALRLQHVPLLLSGNLSADKLESLDRLYLPNAILLPESRHEEFRKSSDLPDFVQEISSGHVLWSDGFYTLLSLRENPPAMNPDLRLLLSTSGSTGSPKLVRLSAKNLQANARSIAGYLEITNRERPITSLPMEYTYGLSVINSHILCGARILLTDCTFADQEFWSFLHKYHATSFAGVPYSYQILYRLGPENLDLSSIRTMTQAGGKLPKELQAFFGSYARMRRIRFIIMYGQTEATARMSWLPPEECLGRPGSIGIAIPGGSFSLEDEDGRTVSSPDQSGELIYRGPNVSLGTAVSAQDLMLGDSRHGVLHTGDLARRDADGYYYIIGRRKRFLKAAGKRLGLDSVESILRQRWPSCSFICSGTDDHIGIYAVTAESAGQLPDEKEILRFLEDSLRIHHSVFYVRYIAEIPRNNAGKILYSALPD